MGLSFIQARFAVGFRFYEGMPELVDITPQAFRDQIPELIDPDTESDNDDDSDYWDMPPLERCSGPVEGGQAVTVSKARVRTSFPSDLVPDPPTAPPSAHSWTHDFVGGGEAGFFPVWGGGAGARDDGEQGRYGPGKSGIHHSCLSCPKNTRQQHAQASQKRQIERRAGDQPILLTGNESAMLLMGNESDPAVGNRDSSTALADSFRDTPVFVRPSGLMGAAPVIRSATSSSGLFVRKYPFLQRLHRDYTQGLSGGYTAHAHAAEAAAARCEETVLAAEDRAFFLDLHFAEERLVGLSGVRHATGEGPVVRAAAAASTGARACAAEFRRLSAAHFTKWSGQDAVRLCWRAPRRCLSSAPERKISTLEDARLLLWLHSPEGAAVQLLLRHKTRTGAKPPKYPRTWSTAVRQLGRVLRSNQQSSLLSLDLSAL